jgi:Asp-tRNA(Asn)/Glu-tRNA(Gln) amidotransferase C subunit
MSLKDNLIKLKSSLEKRAAELFNAEKITQKQLESITNDCQRILDFAAKINSIELKKVLTDMDDASQKIINATNSLDKAAAQIQGFQNFFEILSSLIRLGEAVSNAIVNGGVAVIGNLVRELQDIGDRLNT